MTRGWTTGLDRLIPDREQPTERWWVQSPSVRVSAAASTALFRFQGDVLSHLTGFRIAPACDAERTFEQLRYMIACGVVELRDPRGTLFLQTTLASVPATYVVAKPSYYDLTTCGVPLEVGSRRWTLLVRFEDEQGYRDDSEVLSRPRLRWSGFPGEGAIGFVFLGHAYPVCSPNLYQGDDHVEALAGEHLLPFEAQPQTRRIVELVGVVHDVDECSEMGPARVAGQFLR